ncbi:hypothetical protein OSTOST_13722, partial [Ostertagia ostertagi]
MSLLALIDVVQMDQLASNPPASEPYEVAKAANTPEFLNLATDNQRKEYIELESNMNVPVGTLRKAQDTWALKIGDPVLSAYGQHVATEDAAKAAETARMDKAVESLSQAAQEADKIIRGQKEINAMVAEQMEQLPKKVINELTVARLQCYSNTLSNCHVLLCSL